MRNEIGGLIVAGTFILGLQSAQAQLEVAGDPTDNCTGIDELYESGDIAGARDRAQLCLQGLEEELLGEVAKFFLPEVAGWTRTGLEQNRAMGLSNISAIYTKDDVQTNVSLTGGGGGGSEMDLGGMLGGFARMGMQSGKQVRVGGLPGSVQPDGSVVVTLENGSFLTFQSSAFSDPDSALQGMGDLINAFPVADINKASK
jgi:hypothetical protein